MSVETQVIKQAYHIAAIKDKYLAAMATRAANALWTMVDAAADISYENRVKGSNITTIDTNVAAASIGSLVTDWLRLHNEYFSLDAGLTGVTSFATALSYYRSRIPSFAVDYLGMASILDVDYVSPDHTVSLGNYAASSSVAGTFTDGSSIDVLTSGPGQVGVYVINQGIVNTNDLVLGVTCKYEDDTTVAVAVTIPKNSTVGIFRLVGKQALTGNYSAPGNGTISIAATGQFKQGQQVVLSDDNLQVEVAEIVTIVTNTSLTLKKIGAVANNLFHSWTTAANAYVVPLFKDVTAVTNSDGNTGDDVEFKFCPDRPIDITA